MSNTVGFACMLENTKPNAVAVVKGDDKHPWLTGTVSFYELQNGTLIVAEIFGLPHGDQVCDKDQIFAFHIHRGGSCSGNSNDPFANAGSHFNPLNCPHPDHAGDLPPLLGNNGYAWSAVVTDRFTVNDVLNRTVVIHENPDDFKTQPSGNSGGKIACGVIL